MAEDSHLISWGGLCQSLLTTIATRQTLVNAQPVRVISCGVQPAGRTSSSAVMITPTEAASRRSLIGSGCGVFLAHITGTEGVGSQVSEIQRELAASRCSRYHR